jgi:predicted small secreted protein
LCLIQYETRLDIGLPIDADLNLEDAFMSNKTLSKVVNAMLIAGLAVVFTGCNTMHGAGKDIERGGEKIQDKADEHR